MRFVLTGADIVLPDQIITGGAIHIQDGLIGDIDRMPRPNYPDRAVIAV